MKKPPTLSKEQIQNMLFDESINKLKEEFTFEKACEIAQEIMNRAKVIMYELAPYTNGYLTRLPIYYHRNVPTAGISGKGVICFNPWAVIHWSGEDSQADVVAFVLYHEILHAFFEHVKETQNLNLDLKLSNIAHDLVINQEALLSNFNKPDIGVFVGEGLFENYPKDATSEKYYELLLKEVENQAGENGEEPFPDIEIGCGSGGGGKKEDWEEDADADCVAEIDLESAKQDMASDIFAESAKNPGSVSQLLQRQAELLQKPRLVDWRKVIKRVLNDTITYSRGSHDHTYSRLNRRQESLGGSGENVPRLASMLGARSRVAVAFDTSGSVCQEDLLQYILELDNLVKKCDTNVSIYVCDCKAVKICENFKSVADTLTRLKGGGGTDFDPIFDIIAEEKKKKKKYKTLIYFTDGYANLPKNQPNDLNVIWIIVNGEDPGLKGRVIKLNTRQAN